MNIDWHFSPIFALLGTPITYYPGAGLGVPISARALFSRNQLEQPVQQPAGYFADIEVDGSVITAPGRKDSVEFATGERYVVNKVSPSDPTVVGSNWILQLHRQ